MANQVVYGFHSLQTLFDQRVTTVGVRQVSEAIDQALAEHNRQINALVALFVERTTDIKRNYKQGGVRRLQPGDEFARALPTQAGTNYDIAFPLQKGMDALGFTYEASIKATVREVNDALAAMLMADARWMRDHLLAALLDNTSWTFTDDHLGALTIQPLANADTITYQIFTGGDAGATDNHYIAQTAAIADATNPYPLIRTELLEHAENGGEVVSLIPTGLVATTKALATFDAVSDPNLQRGANTDVLVGTLGVPLPGTIIGYADGVWVAEWRSLPANVILSATTQGNRALGMREHAEPELQGFKKDADRIDYPWYEQQWARRAGFGGNNRVGAVVYEVNGGDTTYDIPTGYDTPMP